jgi:hypothetical protein
METLRELGLQFKAEDGVVTICAVDAGGEGEAVGLMVGDVIDGVDAEEMVVELCDDSRELRATVMRIRRGGVALTVELFADAVPVTSRGESENRSADAHLAREVADSLVAEFQKYFATAAEPARAREEEPIEPALNDVSPAAPTFDDAQTPFGARPYPPNCPKEDRRFFDSLGRSVSYQASDGDYNAFGWLPDRGAI